MQKLFLFKFDFAKKGGCQLSCQQDAFKLLPAKGEKGLFIS